MVSLTETLAIQKIANNLYSFLPGQPHPYADQKISFSGVAYDLDLGAFWSGGSKLPALTNLLVNTLERKKSVFCQLILEIVKRAIKYRENKGEPITREEIEELNELILKVNFKIPELWSEDFLNNLPSQKKQDVDIEKPRKAIGEAKRQDMIRKLQEIMNLTPQERGYVFEKFLKELFEVFWLKPRSSFRIIGEQIDGSLELDGETYLIEAKWESKKTGIQDLLGFNGKITGKATWSRGIFISYNGFTDEALTAFLRGRPTNLITLTAQDLYFILVGREGFYLCLDDAIRMKVRYAAETGNIGVSVYELLISMEGKKDAKQ